MSFLGVQQKEVEHVGGVAWDLPSTGFITGFFEIGEGGAPAAKRVVFDSGDGRSRTDIGFSEIESLARAFDIEGNPLTIRAVVQQIEEAGFASSLPAVAGGIDAERSQHYASQSGKTLLKEYFEQNPNPPTLLDLTHPTTSLSADQMIQFARAVGFEVALASYWTLEDVLLKANVGQSAVPRVRRGGQLPFSSRCG